MLWPDGPDEHRLLVNGIAQDRQLGHTTDRSEIAAEVVRDAGRRLVALTSTPHRPRLAELVDTGAASGFRDRSTALLAAAEVDGCLHQLLDDLPVGVLVAGYSRVLARPFGRRRGPVPRLDVCAGMRTGATMHRAVVEDRDLPLTPGPPGPRPADPLPPLAVRRRRDIAVHRDGDGLRVDASLDDSWSDHDGRPRTFHAYRLTARVDADLLLRDVLAEPLVLPYPECPLAAGGAARMVGTPLRELRGAVGVDLRGVASCTHLNDLIRSLAGVRFLLG